ncbi:MAG: hypothetical protein QOE70_5200 [Chthoniobacter sp.]|jgi:putative membrane-bound dehydrogenase-like protein|nr:hypothetical protein [Chthoniobacter sp.]
MSPRFLPRCAIALPLFALSFAQADERPKLTAEKWSAEINVPDPVACSVDEQGRVFVTSTTRRKTGDLDIREWTQWIPDDQSFQSIEDKEAFYHRVLAPGLAKKPDGPLTDANHDGSIDWKDLTVPTERIYRLVDSNGDGKADQITTFAEGFQTEVTGIAAGVLAFGGSVYSTIAPDLWRLVDKDGDGKSDSREIIAHGFGLHIAYAGHDMHGLRVGPDGRIYWSIGDKGVNVTSKEGRKFFYPNEGCVLRCEPDGSHFEVFAHGLRNVQETDFNEVGDLFGVDNDADKPGEKERLVFIAEQSDSGWRCGFQYMKGVWCPWTSEGRWQPEHPMQPLFITPPIVNSHDGPAGFVYNPGTALAPAWRGWFFLDQFPSGKMNALRLEPAGAAWKLAEDVPISSGIMGIGMSWGPEGKLYFADWMGGYPLDQKGAVWTLDAPDADRDPLRAEVQSRLRDGFAKLAPDALRALLGHADVRLRKGAQFELAKGGAWEVLLAVARDQKAPPLARLHAVWGLGQGLRWGKWAAPEALVALCGDPDSEVRAQTAKILGEGPAQAPLTRAIVALIKDPNPRVRFHAALASARLKIPEASAPLLQAVREHGDGDPWLRHALVTGLAGCAPAGDLAANAHETDRAVRLACLLALARNHDAAITTFLGDRDPRLAAEAAIAIHDDLGIPDALPQLAAWLAKAPADSTEAALRRAVNANFRLGTPEAAARVAAFALGSAALASVREEALTQLTLWLEPPPLDHADGRFRAFPARPLEPVRAALQPQVAALLALEAPELRALGLELLVKFHLEAPADKVAALVAEKSIPAAVRLEALRLLAAQEPNSPELARMLDAWLAAAKGAHPAALRSEALRIVAKRDGHRAFEAARKFLAEGEVAEQQAAWSVLGALAAPDADALIAGAVTELAAGHPLPPATQLDLLEAAATRAANAPTIAAALGALEKNRSAPSDPLVAFAECLEGGDPLAGREIALTSVAANCVACHRFQRGGGSEVGPPLETVASRRDRHYLLESLIAPSAQVAAGFGLVTVTKKSGEPLAGTLLGEDAKAIRLRQPDGQEISVAKADIASQTPAISVMPPMGALLTKRQIRDVVAYLTTLKPAPKEPKKAKPKGQE